MRKKVLNLLELRPVRLCEFEPNPGKDGKCLSILVPRFGRGKIASWLSKKVKKPYAIIHLDEFGSFVWDCCDGETKVTEIGDALKKHFGDKIEPVYDRLSIFLNRLEKSGYITFREISKTKL